MLCLCWIVLFVGLITIFVLLCAFVDVVERMRKDFSSRAVFCVT